LSILGTTGIVRPVSAEAWTETIRASLNVAREAGLREVVLSTGRTSEKGVARLLDLPEEAYAMMGDFLLFSLQESAAKGFEQIHFAGMWAKIMKAALRIPHTHVRHGALRMGDCLNLLDRLGAGEDVLAALADVNTAREIYQRLADMEQDDLVRKVCCGAKAYAEDLSGLPVQIYLVASGGKVEMHV
jgi:cobalt-precorrin-5B (C1)-methyltransferase